MRKYIHFFRQLIRCFTFALSPSGFELLYIILTLGSKNRIVWAQKKKKINKSYFGCLLLFYLSINCIDWMILADINKRLCIFTCHASHTLTLSITEARQGWGMFDALLFQPPGLWNILESPGADILIPKVTLFRLFFPLKLELLVRHWRGAYGCVSVYARLPEVIGHFFRGGCAFLNVDICRN